MATPPRLPNAKPDSPSVKSRDRERHDPAIVENPPALDLVPAQLEISGDRSHHRRPAQSHMPSRVFTRCIEKSLEFNVQTTTEHK